WLIGRATCADAPLGGSRFANRAAARSRLRTRTWLRSKHSTNSGFRFRSDPIFSRPRRYKREDRNRAMLDSSRRDGKHADLSGLDAEVLFRGVRAMGRDPPGMAHARSVGEKSSPELHRQGHYGTDGQ